MQKVKSKKAPAKKTKRGSKGFTMIELILVIVVLGILSVLALPMFTNITSSARTSARDNVVASVKTAINLYRANLEASGLAPAYPATLDALSAGSCGSSAACFATILSEPVTDTRWQKISDTSYGWSASAGAATADVTYTYDPTAGTFQ